MSGLVDMWTSELAKLKNKGEAEADLSNGSASAPSPHSQGQEAADEKRGDSLWWSFPSGLAQALRAEKLPALKCSETSLSTLMDSISA